MEDIIIPDVVETSNKRILDKTQSELTIGDELKLSAASTALVVGVIAGGLGLLYAVGGVSERLKARKARKAALDAVVEEKIEQIDPEAK